MEIYNVQGLKSVFVLICAVQIRNIETFHCFVLRRTSAVYVHAWVHQGFMFNIPNTLINLENKQKCLLHSII